MELRQDFQDVVLVLFFLSVGMDAVPDAHPLLSQREEQVGQQFLVLHVVLVPQFPQQLHGISVLRVAEIQYLVKGFQWRLATRGSVGTVVDSPAYGGPAERESNAASVPAVQGTA